MINTNFRIGIRSEGVPWQKKGPWKSGIGGIVL